jgi:hypothetical protein
MEKIEPVHSYDFNKDGWVPRYCIACGVCSDSEKTIIPHVVVGVLGQHFIERVVENICRNKLHKNYTFKKEIIKSLKNNDFFDVVALAEEIYLHCHNCNYSVTKDYITMIIYSELDSSAFVQFTVTSR